MIMSKRFVKLKIVSTSNCMVSSAINDEFEKMVIKGYHNFLNLLNE